jgi:hypothetical protein
MAKVRTALIGGVMAMVLVAACGGGGGKKDTTTTTKRTTTTTAGSTTTTGRSTTTSSSGALSGAKVRVVNAAVQNGAGAEIDVWAGQSASGTKPLATVEFGAASNYFNPPKQGSDSTLSFYFHGKTDDASKLIAQSASIGSGDQQTWLVWYGADNGSGTPVGHDQQIVEAAPAGSPNAANVPKVPDQSSLLQVAGAQLGTLPGNLSFDLGGPVGGCLPQQAAPGADTGGNGVRDLIGGTGLVDYVTAAGTQQIALFSASSGNCASAPAAGPTNIDPPVGSVTLVVAYGTSPQAIKLLSLPVSY